MNSRLKTLSVTGILAFALSAAHGNMLYTASGTFAEGDPLNSSGYFHHTHEVRVEAGVTVEVIARSELDTTIEATFPDGTTLFNDDYEGLNPGFIHTFTEGGVMLLSVAPFSRGVVGDYELFVEEVQNLWLQMNDRTKGFLDGETGGRNRYQLAGTEGTRVVIDLMSDDFDAYLELVDEDGNQFYDDDGGEGLNSRLVYVFERDGTVTITARSFSGSDSGTYTLQVQSSSADLIAEYEGSLHARSPRGYDGRPLSRYEFSGAAGDVITITLDSDDFDAMLFVTFPDGRRLAMDDDGGSGTNSKLDAVLPEDGTYIIYATSYSEGGEGAYLLRIFR